MKLKLNRLRSDAKGTFGVILDEAGEIVCRTVELPWRENRHGDWLSGSCVPIGTYEVTPHESITHPKTWILNDVPDRNGILIHVGNTIKDLRGCIAPGLSEGYVAGLPAVIHSHGAMMVLAELVGGFEKSFTLTITNESEES